MSWQQYHQKLKGRSPRALYLKAIDHFPNRQGAAIDLGCGSGAETIDLLRRGWKVTAVDREVSSMDMIRSLLQDDEMNELRFIHRGFEEIVSLTPSDFIFAYHSLPFCQTGDLERIWSMIQQSLKSGGVFAGSFFGMNDDWVKDGQCVGVTEEKILELFSGFEILFRKDTDQVGPTALRSAKHWHTIEVILRKQASK